MIIINHSVYTDCPQFMSFMLVFFCPAVLYSLLSIVFTQHFQVFVFGQKKFRLPCPAEKQWWIPGRLCRTTGPQDHTTHALLYVSHVIHMCWWCWWWWWYCCTLVLFIITGPGVYSSQVEEELSVPAQSGPACCQHHRQWETVLNTQFGLSENEISGSRDIQWHSVTLSTQQSPPGFTTILQQFLSVTDDCSERRQQRIFM